MPLRLRHVLPILLLLAFSSPLFASSEILDTGRQPGVPASDAPLDLSEHAGCRILYFSLLSSATFEISALQEGGLDVTRSFLNSDLLLSNLLNYDVLIVAFTGDVILAGRQADIEAFVSSGGALLVHQPGEEGLIDYTPAGFEIDIVDRAWCNRDGANTLGNPEACIVAPGHPLVAGLTNDDLSGDYDLVGSLGPGFTLVAENCSCGDPAIAVGTFGAGRIVFDTGNFAVDSLHPASDAGLSALFSYLCDFAVVPTDATSWGTVKSRHR